MNKGRVESLNAEIAVSTVNCASLRMSGMITDPGFILIATITSGEDVFLGHPTLISSAFHINADRIDLI
jgi:hypothetical protein